MASMVLVSALLSSMLSGAFALDNYGVQPWEQPVQPIRLFDCHFRYEDWENVWSSEWKQWCCEHELRGCPSTSTAKTTATATTTTKTSTTTTETTTTATTTTTTITTITTTTTTNLGCGTNCTFAGHTASCEERIGWTMVNDLDLLQTANNWGADQFQKRLCEEAGDTVMAQCPSCDICPTKLWCSTSTTTTNLGCGTFCTFSHNNATCKDRIHWAMTHDTQSSMSDNPCETAGQLVVSQCSVCGVCPIQSFCGKYHVSHRKKKLFAIADSFFKKFDLIDNDGLFARTGLSKFMSASLIMACAVAGIGFTVVLWRSAAPLINLAITARDQQVEGYADPLCPTADEQGSSESA